MDMATSTAQSKRHTRKRLRTRRGLLVIIGVLAVLGWGLMIWQDAESLPMTGVASELDPVDNLRQFFKERNVPATITTLSDHDHQGPREQWRSFTFEVSLNRPNRFYEWMEEWREQIKNELSGRWNLASGGETERDGKAQHLTAFSYTGTSLLTNSLVQVRIVEQDDRTFVISYYAHEFPK